MKWIIGGTVLAVVGAVYKRPELMMWVVYTFAFMFGCWGLALFFAYFRSKHHGLLLLGITFVSAAILAAVLPHWWPLVAGFAVAWLLRAMGMDPVPEETTGAPTQSSSPENGKKD